MAQAGARADQPSAAIGLLATLNAERIDASTRSASPARRSRATNTANDASASPGVPEQDPPTRRWRGLLLAQRITAATEVRAARGKSPLRRSPDRAHDLLYAEPRGGFEAGRAAPRRERLLLAQVLGTATASDAGADAPPAAGAAASDEPAAPSLGWFGWGLPPLRWGGSVKTEIQMSSSANGLRRLQRIESGNIQGASYIYQPWFAQVSGGLGLLVANEQQSAGAGLSAQPARSAKSGAVTGKGDVTLFPISRFPFNAYFDVSDSRASGEVSTADITNTRFGLRQSYRSLEGGDSYTASFNRSTLESLSFGRDTVNALAASMVRGSALQSFNLSGSHTSNTRSNSGERTAFSQIYGRHSYRPDAEFSVESLASASNSQFRLLSDGVPANNRSHFAQANSFATWRPEEDSPLNVSGGARIFRATIANNNAAEVQSLSLGANLGATYRFSQKTSVAGSATVTQLLADGASRRVTTQSASVNHVGDPAAIYGSRYAWNAAANLSNQTGTADGARQNLGGQLGHNLTRGVTLGENSQANIGLGQSAGVSFDTVLGPAQTLSHNANASLRLSRGTATSAYVSLFGIDTQTSGRLANHFQMINFQASGQFQFGSNSAATLNLTVQGVRQSTTNATSAPDTTSTTNPGMNFNTSGNLNYFHRRAFDVPRLRYSAIYSANESQFKSRLQGDIDAPRERINQSFEQRLDYTVGRLAFRMSMRFARIEGRRDALLLFTMNRDFGGF